MIRRLLTALTGIVLLAVVVCGWLAWSYLDRHESFKEPSYDIAAPQLPEDLGQDAILVFSKTNSFRHIEAIAAVEQLFRAFAQREGLRIVVTENAAVHAPELLSRFRLVVWNNNTGDVLLPAQQEALRAWIEGGGRWLGIHGAGGSPSYGWDWYADELLRARFSGHTLLPHVPEGTLLIEDRAHPAMAHLPARWTRSEEWYSFGKSPRAPDLHVLASLDESSYSPSPSLLMGGDHPMLWWHRVGAGYVFYSALGHEASAYEEPGYRTLLENAARWLISEAPATLLQANAASSTAAASGAGADD